MVIWPFRESSSRRADYSGPVDRLLREKALDLYRFIEKVVRNPGQLRITRKVTLGNKADDLTTSLPRAS